MILDSTLTFAEDPTVVAAGIIGDVIDLDVADSKQFDGNIIHVAITITADITGDLGIDVMSHSTATVSSGVVHQSINVPNANAVAGTVVRVPLASISALGRYVGLVQSSGTVGSITAALALDVDSNVKSLPDAVN